MSLKTLLKRAPRHSVNMNAWIRRPSSFATQECRVLDVSRGGVRLEAANPFSIPENFILLFSKGDIGCHATVKWRRGTQLGAEFSRT
jgi:PilZ domain-containing protein